MVGNGFYIVRPCGPDLHGPTYYMGLKLLKMTKEFERMLTITESFDFETQQNVEPKCSNQYCLFVLQAPFYSEAKFQILWYFFSCHLRSSRKAEKST